MVLRRNAQYTLKCVATRSPFKISWGLLSDPNWLGKPISSHAGC